MFSKRLKTIVSLAICSLFIFGVTSCVDLKSSLNEDNQKTNYKITSEMDDEAVNLKMSNMPISNFWFPKDLLNWDPTADKNIEYNRATVPLAERVSKDNLTPVNETQNKDFKIVALSIMNGNTSGNSSQGSNKFSANTFSYWQYIDKLVYWGGSSGEGIIVPPTADVIDSAHKNGVPVLGTIFFPEPVHGGKMEWVDEFFQKDDNGNFPMVDKLIEACKVLGFDGWFMNYETRLSPDKNLSDEENKIRFKNYVDTMQAFIKQFKAKSNFDFMWYDSIINDGSMDWQNTLNEKNQMFMIDENGNKVADEIFLNFWWTNNSRADKELVKAAKVKAEELGLNPYDVFAGIDMQDKGTNTKIRWNLIADQNKVPYTSLGLYCPSWTFFSSDSVDDFLAKENRLWVNEFGDPSKSSDMSDGNFIGMSTYAIEKTVLKSAPFSTNFNIGNGYNYFINGEKVSSLDWNNRSLSGVMPTYRWLINNEGSNALKGSIDYANAFYGGNSIKFAGNFEAGNSSVIKLFSSDFEIEEDTKFSIQATSNSDVSVSLVLEFDDGETQEISGDKKVNSNWTNIKFDVSELDGRIVKTISYKLLGAQSSKDFSFNLGEMRITNGISSDIVDIENLEVDDVVFEEDDSYAGVRLYYESDDDESVDHYEIFKVNEDKSKVFLGATLKNSFFIGPLPRGENESKTYFEVVAVNKDNVKGRSKTTEIDWPIGNIPKSNFEASKTIVSVGEEIKFKNLSSKASKDFSWVFEGADIETSNEKEPVVKYSKEGKYTVKLKSANDTGEDEKIIEEYITVTNDANGNFKNVSANKQSFASSFVNPNEASDFAFDGNLNTKWCATGLGPHDITVDLGKVYTIGEVRISHAEAGNESRDMNTSDYTILVSEDGNNFTEVASVKKNNLGNTVHTFKATNARYVKINITKPTQGSDTAVRIYEIEVYGIDK